MTPFEIDNKGTWVIAENIVSVHRQDTTPPTCCLNMANGELLQSDMSSEELRKRLVSQLRAQAERTRKLMQL